MRDSNIELLRFIMMVILCFWHIMMHGYGLSQMSDGSCTPTYIQLALLCIMAFPVDCFIFISGYYGIILKKEKLIRMFLQATFFFIVCVIFRYLIHIGDTIPTGILFTNLIPITNKAWWFLAWYTVLVLISPIIELGTKSLGRNTYMQIIVFLFIINNVGTWLNRLHTGSDFVGLFTIYLIGRYMNRFKTELSGISSFASLITATLILIALVLTAQYYHKSYFTWTFLMFCNPLIVIQSIALFYMTKRLPPNNNRVAGFLGAHCFAIYLLTEFSGNWFYRWWRSIFENYGMSAMLFSVLIICMTICFIDDAQNRIMKRLSLFLLNIYDKSCAKIAER